MWGTLGALALALATAGCGTRLPGPADIAMPPSGVDSATYRVQPGDVLEVKFLYHTSENQRLAVRPDGGLALSITGDLPAAGHTVDELEEMIRDSASRFLREPVVNVTVAESGARAYVGGEVSSAGFVSLGKPMNVLQAVFERGGFTTGAKLSEVLVISRSEGQAVAVRRLDLETAMKQSTFEGAMLSPDDVVYVPKTGIARANSWMSQWIDGLTPEFLKNIKVAAF